ncbi:HTH domain-containing protein [Streptomyces sp. NPDC007251]|uniref:helix-turn-helix transcriptional regulator n=1 Tax=Streptomyces sp. NPDC007251 TaxID=3154483 RepID=UPI0033E6E367
MNRTARLYALVEELRAAAPRPLTVAALASRFEISTRTVQRDLQALLETGVPVRTTPGRGGGWSIDPAMTLPPMHFTPRKPRHWPSPSPRPTTGPRTPARPAQRPRRSQRR